MAKFKVIHRSKNGSDRKYHDANALNDLIFYIQCEDRTNPSLVGGLAVNPFAAAEEMEGITALAGKQKGVHLRHFIISFSPEELQSAKTAFNIAKDIAEFYADRHQIVYAVHTNKCHLHIHFIMNTVSYQTGMKYAGDRKDFYLFQTHMRRILHRYGLRQEVQFVKDTGTDSE